MSRFVALTSFLLALTACGPAPGYTADGEYVADPNAGLESPRRAPNQQAQTSGGQSNPQGQPQQGQPQGDPNFYDNLSSASGQPQGGAAPAGCDNSCRFANNGECDDGRQGSDTDVCAQGTDCNDCGG
jgi:hypothetical protein